MAVTVGDVRGFILKHFSEEDLKTLCFVYFQEVETAFSDSMSLEAKTRVLIDHCQKQGKVSNLFHALQTERPLVFPQFFSGPLALPQPLPAQLDDEFPESKATIVSVSALQVSEVLADRMIAEKSASIRLFALFLAVLLGLGILIIAGALLFFVDATRQVASAGGLFVCSLGAWQVRIIADRSAQRSRCQTIKSILTMINQGQRTVDAETWKQIQDYLWNEMQAPVAGEKVLI